MIIYYATINSIVVFVVHDNKFNRVKSFTGF